MVVKATIFLLFVGLCLVSCDDVIGIGTHTFLDAGGAADGPSVGAANAPGSGLDASVASRDAD
jgi:hypothetical protein